MLNKTEHLFYLGVLFFFDIKTAVDVEIYLVLVLKFFIGLAYFIEKCLHVGSMFNELISINHYQYFLLKILEQFDRSY